jgi:hypothetical protein
MLKDIVVDTNVFCHACDPNNPFFTPSVEFLASLERVATSICIDGDLDLAGAQNKSTIGQEYLTYITQPPALPLLTLLFSTGRVSSIDRKVPPGIKKKIKLLVGDRDDEIFLRVAYNSQEKKLVSHDGNAFPEWKLTFKQLGVEIRDAERGVELL